MCERPKSPTIAQVAMAMIINNGRKMTSTAIKAKVACSMIAIPIKCSTFTT